MSTAQTGRTHDLHPTASKKPKNPLTRGCRPHMTQSGHGRRARDHEMTRAWQPRRAPVGRPRAGTKPLYRVGPRPAKLLIIGRNHFDARLTMLAYDRPLHRQAQPVLTRV